MGIGGLLADETESGDATPFLVDGDEGLNVGEIAQVVDEFAELLWGDNVSAKEDEATGLELFETGGGVGVEFRSGDTGEEELAEKVGVGHGGDC